MPVSCCFLIALATLAIVLGTNPSGAQSTRTPLSHEVPTVAQIGQLAWRGGLELTDPREGFGGLSALEIDASGRNLTALTDRGAWLRLALQHDARGFLVAARLVQSGRLINVDGQPFQRKQDRDSESLARLSDGSFVVAFEHRHRLLLYPPTLPPFSKAPRWLNPPPGIHAAPPNGGMEALTQMVDDRLFVLSEKLALEDGTVLGWVGDGRRWSPLRYRPAAGFHATGATLLPDGDVLVLERRLSLIGGFAARLVRLPPAAIDRATTDPAFELEGDEIARLQAPLNMDNFEAVTAHRSADGETIIYLMSDDNFFALQRTLLFAFALTDSQRP